MLLLLLLLSLEYNMLNRRRGQGRNRIVDRVRCCRRGVRNDRAAGCSGGGDDYGL